MEHKAVSFGSLLVHAVGVDLIPIQLDDENKKKQQQKVETKVDSQYKPKWGLKSHSIAFFFSPVALI